MAADPYLWPNKEAALRLERLLQLPATGEEQDWEVELSDETRIGEWLALLEAGELDLEERSALGLLITCSILYAGADATPPEMLGRLRAAFRADETVRARMLEYWEDFSEPTGDAAIDAENAAFRSNVTIVLG